LNSLTSASGQRTYEHAIREFVAWYCSEPRLEFNRTVVFRWVSTEGKSGTVHTTHRKKRWTLWLAQSLATKLNDRANAHSAL
jgi:hypothetical protein